jgi:hypothetical protein
MADIFEFLAFQAEEDNEPLRKAASIAVSRAERIFPFLAKSETANEFSSRLALVQDDIDQIVKEACEEFGYGDAEHISKIVRGQIELIAADVDSGDNYYQRRDDMPTAPKDGQLSEPSPKLNPETAGDEWHTSQEAPEIESVRHRNVVQNAQDVADYAADLDTSHPLVQRVDADTPMQPEFNVGDPTKVFPKQKNQAQPVASVRKRANEDLLFISDPGHGWLRVPYESAFGLGISNYSYQDGQYAYLEEDADAGKWLRAHPEVEVRSIPEKNEPVGDSFVRGLPRFEDASDSLPNDAGNEPSMESAGPPHVGSNLESEFRKRVEEAVKNGLPAESIKNEFDGLQETVKTNIINELRGQQTFSSEKKTNFGEVPTDPMTQKIVDLMAIGKKTFPEIRDSLGENVDPVVLRDKMRQAEHVIRMQNQVERSFANDFMSKKKLPKSMK